MLIIDRRQNARVRRFSSTIWPLSQRATVQKSTSNFLPVGGMVFLAAITKGPFMVPVNLAIEHRPTRRARSASYTACCRCDCRGRSCSPPHKISWNCPGASLLPSPLQNTKPPPCRIARSAAASSGVRSTQRCRLLFGAFSSPSHFGADLLAAKHLISKPLRPRSGRWAVSLGRQRSINFRPPTPRASH